jgi:hypothetical protein
MAAAQIQDRFLGGGQWLVVDSLAGRILTLDATGEVRIWLDTEAGKSLTERIYRDWSKEPTTITDGVGKTARFRRPLALAVRPPGSSLPWPAPPGSGSTATARAKWPVSAIPGAWPSTPRPATCWLPRATPSARSPRPAR